MSGTLAFLLGGLLASLPLTPPSSGELNRHGPALPELTQGQSLRNGGWMRSQLGTHPNTEFQAKAIRRRDGSVGVWLMRETLHGIPIAGARVALRSDGAGRLRQVVGRWLAADARLPVAPRHSVARALWWPLEEGLVLARVETTPLRFVHGQPEQFEVVYAVSDGRELARWSVVDDSPVPIRGWAENPVVTPQSEIFSIDLDDQDPLRLENGFLRIWDCDWDAQTQSCAMTFFPEGDPAVGFVEAPPPIEDDEAHRDPADAFAGVQMTQFGMRFYDRLLSWGWDPYVWDLLDCSWQEVEPQDCRVFGRVNVQAQDEQGVFPYSGAFYSTGSGIWMGQGNNADTSFEGDIVVHEFGHHVTRGYGVPEPIDKFWDRSRRYVDRSSINEGTSDFFARQMSSNDLIYDYFVEVEPSIYVDNRTRHIGQPFRCPENLVGEVHMDGRIWASALRAIQLDLAAAGIADEDEFMAAFLVAHAAVRQIPTQDLEQFPEAADIVIDELRTSFGAEAQARARAIFDARGLRICSRRLDLREDPSFQGTASPDDPLDDRFMVFTSHRTSVEPAIVQSHPWAPALHHFVELEEGETELALRFRPGYWRPARVGEAPPEFTLGLLMKRGDQEIAFWSDPDPELSVVTNDAELRFVSTPVDAEGWAEVRAVDLTPNASYAIALVSLSAVDGELFVIEEMQWSIGASGGEEGGDESSSAEGEAGEGDTGEEGAAGTVGSSDEGGADGRANGAISEVSSGCACATASAGGRGAAPLGWLAALSLLGLRVRRCRST